MDVEVRAGNPTAIGADLIAAGPARAAELGAPDRAVTDADPVAMVYRTGAPLAVVAVEPDGPQARIYKDIAAQVWATLSGGRTAKSAPRIVIE